MHEGLTFEKKPDLAELFLKLSNMEFQEELEKLPQGSSVNLRVVMSEVDDQTFSMKAFALKALIEHPPSNLDTIEATIVGTKRQMSLKHDGNELTSGVGYEIV